MSRTTFEANPLPLSPRYLKRLQTQRFDFSKRRVLDPKIQQAKQLQQSAARQKAPDYLTYLRETLPKNWTADAEHIRLIAQHLDAIERGEIDRLAIHMPPRHAKTETVSVRAAPWMMERSPTENVLLTGYNERFARRLGRKSRGVATARQAEGHIHLAPDKLAADEWATVEGGTLMTRGVGSPPTGTGFRRIFIDDPIRRREDAESEVYREKVWDWYTDDLYTRLEPDGAIILVMTPWHEDDVGARAVASEPGRWTVLKLPAFAVENDPLGREPGRALWPARFNEAALDRIKQVMIQNEGERSWEALYQMNPKPRQGSFFKVGKLKIVAAAPNELRMCRAWDFASTEGGGAFSAGAKLGVTSKNEWIVLHMQRGQWGPDEVEEQVVQTAKLDGRKANVHIPQDPGQAGVKQALTITRLLSGFNVKSEPVTGSKENRAFSFAAQVNAGNVSLLEGEWNAAFIEELRGFPGGKYKDQVDSASDAFNDLARLYEQKAKDVPMSIDPLDLMHGVKTR